MATNTPDPSSPIADMMNETPMHIVGDAANVMNKILLRRHLGLFNLATSTSRAVADTAAGNIFSKVDTTRYGIAHQAALSDILQPEIEEAMQRVRMQRQGVNAMTSLPDEQRYAFEISGAIIKSLDKRILDDMMRHASLNVENPPNPYGLADHEILIETAPYNVATTPPTYVDVIINTRDAFWVNEGPFSHPDELEAALKGKFLGQVGIRIAGSGNALAAYHPIPDVMAYHLAHTARVTMNHGDRLSGSPSRRTSEDLCHINGLLHEQSRNLSRFSEGNDNYGSAALATAILQECDDKELHKIMGGIGNRAEIQNSYDTAQYDLYLQTLLEKLETGAAAFVPTANYADVLDKIHAISVQEGIAIIPGTTVLSMPAFGSFLAESYAVPAGGTPMENSRQVQLAKEWLRERRKEYEAHQKQYKDLQSLLRPIFLELNRRRAGGVTITANISNAFTTAVTPDPAWFTTALNIKDLANEVRSDLRLKAKNILEEEAVKYRQQLSDIDAGKVSGAHGADAQQKVIAKYLEIYHKKSPKEAEQAAQYLRSQLLLDRQTSMMLEQLAEETGPEVRGRWRTMGDYLRGAATSFDMSGDRDIAMLDSIALAAGIDRQGYWGDQNRRRNWEGASYPQLLTAYFTMQTLLGKKEPAKVRLPRSRSVLDERKRIIAAIASKYSAAAIRDFGEMQGMSNEQIDAAIQDPTKQEHMYYLMKILESDPPPGYAERVAKAVEKVNARHERVWRGATAAAGATVGGGWKLTKGGYSLGKQFVIDRPKAFLAPKVDAARNAIDNNKGRIVTAAVLSAFFSPVIGIPAAWIMVRSKDGHGVLAA